jgi:hypothetical protein
MSLRVQTFDRRVSAPTRSESPPASRSSSRSAARSEGKSEAEAQSASSAASRAEEPARDRAALDPPGKGDAEDGREGMKGADRGP